VLTPGAIVGVALWIGVSLLLTGNSAGRAGQSVPAAMIAALDAWRNDAR
jgi:hypothetical protein